MTNNWLDFCFQVENRQVDRLDRLDRLDGLDGLGYWVVFSSKVTVDE